MMRNAGMFAISVVIIVIPCSLGLAQSRVPAILEVDIENIVEYQSDISDPSKFGVNPDVTPSSRVVEFGPATVIGDIVAVNGHPAKGTFVGRHWGMGLSPDPLQGRPIADTKRISVGFRTFEFLNSDGTSIGTIMALGLNGGSPPPGASQFSGQNFAIVVGTGAFLGVRGQQGGERTSGTTLPRAASISEDPASRRRNGGGRVQWLLAVIPISLRTFVGSDEGHWAGKRDRQ